MYYKVYRLSFSGGVHIGNGRLSDTDITMHADTFFSAVCIEALAVGGDALLISLADRARSGRILISDLMPYINDTMYIPKPMVAIETADTAPSVKKEFKALSFIPWKRLDTYFNGDMCPGYESNLFAALGKRSDSKKAMIEHGDDNKLYSVGVYKFNTGCGLYMIIGFEDEETEQIFDNIMDSLQYTGLGGKLSSGYGRFTYIKSDLKKRRGLGENGKRYMSVSCSMAKDDELDRVISGASYKLIKRSGFVRSDTYAEKQLKKRDLYMFAPGSVFDCRFEGDVFDVSMYGSHPVYRYAKPMFVGLDI